MGGSRAAASRARNRRASWRRCLRLGCGATYSPRWINQRFCGGADCRAEVERWQARERQRRHRSTDLGRERHREAERARRRKNSIIAHGSVPDSSKPGPRGHGGCRTFWPPTCARPGCYSPPRLSIRAPSRYCSDDCRIEVRKVLDRERKASMRVMAKGRGTGGLDAKTLSSVPAERGAAWTVAPKNPSVGGYCDA